MPRKMSIYWWLIVIDESNAIATLRVYGQATSLKPHNHTQPFSLDKVGFCGQ
ncbi:hypothetical protein IQ260_09070 [Leptolyngbya cf. ectocarpi LEGE 11479]|uniref:Uncharacterized protein n=1 Tax=Leptolyngbya cf. ectocarpi LEGE 11479 TaxID=1828722 RepID=A0A928X4Z8_LEPEC|nr:hypothetical protein [Leptolyngbya ectocarpi]MBE9066803.1 hypothetical protein [Leptolyngbya cf. ectocarpi LEGE 11479]